MSAGTTWRTAAIVRCASVERSRLTLRIWTARRRLRESRAVIWPIVPTYTPFGVLRTRRPGSNLRIRRNLGIRHQWGTDANEQRGESAQSGRLGIRFFRGAQ